MTPPLSSSRFFMTSCPVVGGGRVPPSKRFTAHKCHAIRSATRGAFARAASAHPARADPTPALATEVITRACPRLQARHPTAKARVVRLIECGAFADAMLSLLELELPQWKLRRLVCEDGWHCSGVPADLDDMAEAQHESMPLAILGAFIETGLRSRSASEGRRQSVPPVRLTEGYALCCDN